MIQPLISVVVPVYNVQNYLAATLSSIIEQSYPHIEIICVNDGSVDQSAQILEKFRDHIEVIYQDNKGAAASRNTGLKVARGDYIKFWDADDLMNKTHIEAQYQAIKDHPGYVASCKWGRFYDDDYKSTLFKPESVWKNLPSVQWIELALSQNGDMASSWLWLIPRAIIEKTGLWNESLSLNDDFEFSMRLLSNSKGVKFTENAIAYYRSGNSSSLASSTSNKRFKDALESTRLGIDTILKMKHTANIKTLCANRYQEWVYRMYPDHLKLVELAEEQIKKLGDSNKKMDGGKVFIILRYLLGWKLAKRLQLKFYKMGYTPKKNRK